MFDKQDKLAALFFVIVVIASLLGVFGDTKTECYSESLASCRDVP